MSSKNVSIRKIIAYDTKINYRLVKTIQFMSRKLSMNLDYIERYYQDIIYVVNNNVGHNKTHYELFLIMKENNQKLLIETKTYISIDPQIDQEGQYLSKVKSTLEIFLKSFSNYIHNFKNLLS